MFEDVKLDNYHTLFSTKLTWLELCSLSTSHCLSDSNDTCSEASHGDAGGTFTAMGKEELVHLSLQVLSDFVLAGEGNTSSVGVLLHLTHEVFELLLVEHAVLVGVSGTEGSCHLGHPFGLGFLSSGSGTIGVDLGLVLLGEACHPLSSPCDNFLKVLGHLFKSFFLISTFICLSFPMTTLSFIFNTNFDYFTLVFRLIWCFNNSTNLLLLYLQFFQILSLNIH